MEQKHLNKCRIGSTRYIVLTDAVQNGPLTYRRENNIVRIKKLNLNYEI